MMKLLILLLLGVLQNSRSNADSVITGVTLDPDTRLNEELEPTTLIINATGSIGTATFSTFDNVESLEFIDCDFGRINFTAFASDYLPKLKTLSFINTGADNAVVNNFDIKAIENLKNFGLKSSSVDSNKVIYVTQGAFANSQLETLVLSNQHNPNITFEDLEGLTNLKTLSWTKSNIVSIGPDSFKDLTSLTVLRLDGNELSGAIDCSIFDSIGSLEHISLSRNNITGGSTADLCGRKLPKLQTLHLDNNQVDVVDWTTLQGFESLSELDVSDNSIRFFDPVAIYDNLPSLRKINLSNNREDCYDQQLDASYLYTRWLLERGTKIDVIISEECT